MKNSGYYPLFTCYFINLTFLCVKTIMIFNECIRHFKSLLLIIQYIEFYVITLIHDFFYNNMNAIYFFNNQAKY